MESILTSTKKIVGLTEDYQHFDPDIIMCINSVFMILTQMGIGPSTGFRIEDAYTTWDEFIPEDDLNFEAVKTYMGLKVRLMFDPPTSSVLTEVMNQMVSELEWRLNHAAEIQE